jgi:hypothetical protein
MKLKNQQSAYPLLDTLKKLERPLTREHYLAIDGWDNPNRKLTAEEDMELPPQFRGKDETEKPLTPEVEALLPPQFRVKEEPEKPLTPEEFQKWKLENWLRCRCEGDDHFDMCLNCITHRQLTDLVQ